MSLFFGTPSFEGPGFSVEVWIWDTAPVLRGWHLAVKQGSAVLLLALGVAVKSAFIHVYL